MRILYLVFNRGHGSGGHFHSLDQVAREVAKKEDVSIVSLGKHESPVIKRNPYFRGHVYFAGVGSLRAANAAFARINAEFRADVVHCFDLDSYNVVLPLPALWSARTIVTKCGGPNPLRKSWQYANQMIFFSQENYDWFRDNPRYEKCRLYLIANRVASVKLIDTGARSEVKDLSKFNFVRITRLGGAYEKTLIDTFNLVRILKDRFPIHLYVIGKVQDEHRFGELRSQALAEGIPVTFITDKRADKASDLLYLADCVIGTGRSCMEAMSLGIPTLVPAVNSPYPVLVDRGNFHPFFATNFSERGVADGLAMETNLAHIERLIRDSTFKKELGLQTRALFDEFLGTTGIWRKYSEVYSEALARKERRASLLIRNFMYISKQMLSIG